MTLALQVYCELDKAEARARQVHGRRPWPAIAWCNHSMIGEYGIDTCREELLRQHGADRKQVEKEYRDAKERLVDAERAGMAWDIRAGIAPLREQVERVEHAGRRAGMQMAMAEPPTPAGAGAMIGYVWPELVENDLEDDDWPIVALKTVVVALIRMNGEVA